jgi:hypothetical protein
MSPALLTEKYEARQAARDIHGHGHDHNADEPGNEANSAGTKERCPLSKAEQLAKRIAAERLRRLEDERKRLSATSKRKPRD